jgi:hypothetical protein
MIDKLRHKTGFILNGFWLITAVVFSLVMCSKLVAQETRISPEDRELLISRIEEIAERSEEELDYTGLLEDMFYFLEYPLNINYASFDEMKRIFFLTDLQIHKIIEYRNVYGLFVTIYELQAVEGFDRDLIELLEPFIRVSPEKQTFRLRPKNILKYGRHDLFLRYSRVLEEQAGYRELSDSAKAESPGSYYLGSPDRLYMRYGLNYYNRFRIGLTAEKDPGEEFFKGSQSSGFDFYSGFVYASDLGIIEEIVVGDYQLEFGQGLTLWTGLSFGKSPDAVSVVKNQRRLRPNTSVNENLYMRGTAVTVDLSNFKVTGFYSSKKIDGNIGETDTISQEIQFVTSLQETGYHRTNSEVANKNAVHETIFGGNVRYRKNRFQLGATAFKTQYDTPLELPGQLYQKFNFQGDENLNYGLDMNFIVNRFNVFAEVSGSENGGMAYLTGFQAALHPSVALSVFYRNYGIDYQNLYSNAIGESSNNQNESGLYAGILVYLHSNWTFRGYADVFSSPWLKYRVNFPSHGQEYMAQLEYHPGYRLDMYLRYRTKQKQLNQPGDQNMTRAGETQKESFRFHISYRALPAITLKNRIEFSRYQQFDEDFRNGFMMYQDILFRPSDRPYSLTLRYAVFNTESYDERIYAYENDVLYAFSIPAYFYNGSRFYVLMKYDLGSRMDLWFRFAQTFYSDRQKTGSGLTEIDSNTRSEVKVQLRIKL